MKKTRYIKNYGAILIAILLIVSTLNAQENALVIEGKELLIEYQFALMKVGGKNEIIEPIKLVEKKESALKTGDVIEIRLEVGREVKIERMPEVEVIGDLMIGKPIVVQNIDSDQKSIQIEVIRSSTVASTISIKNSSISLNRTLLEGESYPAIITVNSQDDLQVLEIPKLIETRFPEICGVYQQRATRWTIDKHIVTQSKGVPLPRLKRPPYLNENNEMMIPFRYFIEEICEDGEIVAYEEGMTTYRIKNQCMRLNTRSKELMINEEKIGLKNEIEIKEGVVFIGIEDINLIWQKILPEQQVKIRWLIPDKVAEIVVYSYEGD